MRKNSKLVDELFKRAESYFDGFRLPIVWDTLNNSNMAEWGNGFIDGFGEFHMVKLNFRLHENEADLFATICHELIHAWQYENNLETDHGLEFCKMALKFEMVGINAYSSDCLQSDIDHLKAEFLDNGYLI